ncbi:MAG TPA: hybrid sensor histidine kinase/response regulator [Lacunisphaera sp.]|nr:hybrid sensor histidine kinase/response regulator [Lacunisphaera sp.]
MRSSPTRLSIPADAGTAEISPDIAPSGTVAGLQSIHIIDDDAQLCTALSAGLEAFGYRTVSSTSATLGWAAARQEPPDLILCDINMPGTNGHRLLQEIRADPLLGNCQFVFMSGNPTYAHPRVGMNRGADDFLVKPFTLDALVSCVEARLRRKEISRQREATLIGELRASLHKWMPHEFFTPLTGILGFAELLDQDLLTMKPDEVREAVHGIHKSAQRLHRTLRNYLFTLDRLNPDSGAPFPVLKAETVGEVLRRGAEAAVARHDKRRSDLAVDMAPAALSVGPHELGLLVEELLDNAFSFSAPRTPVRLVVRRRGASLELAVTDAGRGMTTEQLKALGAFRQFERPTFEQQGLGLGLFIVRQVVRRLGGRLQINSLPGKGTTCVAVLPVYAEPKGGEVPGRLRAE